MIEGFEHEVSLPFEGGSLRSHIHSPATRKYLFREWSRKLSLSIRASVSMIKKACNMKLTANNQFMEGIIKNEKHTETKAKYYLQEPALYFLVLFYKNLCMASKSLVAELERTKGLLQKRKSKQKEALLALNPIVEGTKHLTKSLNTVRLGSTKYFFSSISLFAPLTGQARRYG